MCGNRAEHQWAPHIALSECAQIYNRKFMHLVRRRAEGFLYVLRARFGRSDRHRNGSPARSNLYTSATTIHNDVDDDDDARPCVDAAKIKTRASSG